ncbi:MAG: helix-turn-helix transcriptional regulator [Flavobacteriales bacterium]|nr:helix-turn-helix transcriptional regulator [Flavobacteriales bacterium]
MATLLGYESNERKLASVVRALAHPARFSILKEIASRGVVTTTNPVVIDQLAPASMVQHLRELKRAGIIKGKIFGAHTAYELNWETIESLQRSLHTFVEELRVSKPSNGRR